MPGRSLLAGLAFLCAAACGTPPVSTGMTSTEVFADPAHRALADAACAGDTEALAVKLTSGADVNAVGRYGVTPLIWALACRGLVFNDIRANAVVARGVGTQAEAPDPPDLSALETLFKAGADPNAMIDGNFGPVYPGADAYWIDGYTPVLIAAEFHGPAILALLLEYGGDPDAMDRDGEKTALILAYERGDWLDLGPQRAPYDGRQWQNLFMLLEAGALLERAPENQSNVVERASAHRIRLAARLLKEHEYTGGFETIVYRLYNGLDMGFLGEADRLALLGYLRDVRGVDIEAVRARYWPDEEPFPVP